ncbi:MAG: hypothetical protein ACJ77M_14450 [Thermoleophilaceae bacterium]|jgi:hypothetical protein
MKARLTAILAALIAMLALAAPALAATDDGQGVVGETDDKIVTFVSLGVLLFFIFVVVVGTFIQIRLDKRKAAMKAARMRQRVGW